MKEKKKAIDQFSMFKVTMIILAAIIIIITTIIIIKIPMINITIIIVENIDTMINAKEKSPNKMNINPRKKNQDIEKYKKNSN